MGETVVQQMIYQVAIHHRNKRLHRVIDIVGMIWNHALALQHRYHRLTGRYISKYTMLKHMRRLRVRSPGRHFSQDLNSQALADLCIRQDTAYQRFFDGLAQGPPKFREPVEYGSIMLRMGNGCKLMESDNPRIGKLRLAFGWYGAEKMIVKYHIGVRPLPDKVNAVIIERTVDGNFWLSFVVEQEQPKMFYPDTGKIGGVFIRGAGRAQTPRPEAAWARLQDYRVRQLEAQKAGVSTTSQEDPQPPIGFSLETGSHALPEVRHTRF